MTQLTYLVEYIEGDASHPTRHRYNADQRVSAVQRARRLSRRKEQVYVVKAYQHDNGTTECVGHLVYVDGRLAERDGDTK